MNLGTLREFAKIVSYLGPTVAAFWAVLVYKSNARRERARWADSLFSRYFIGQDYKTVRDLLDSDPDATEVVEMVKKDAADWTDYLNFFEFVLYLQSTKQLSRKDVDALFGYYLACLGKHLCAVTYIKDKGKSFEYLRRHLIW